MSKETNINKTKEHKNKNLCTLCSYVKKKQTYELMFLCQKKQTYVLMSEKIMNLCSCVNYTIGFINFLLTQ